MLVWTLLDIVPWANMISHRSQSASAAGLMTGSGPKEERGSGDHSPRPT